MNPANASTIAARSQNRAARRYLLAAAAVLSALFVLILGPQVSAASDTSDGAAPLGPEVRAQMADAISASDGESFADQIAAAAGPFESLDVQKLLSPHTAIVSNPATPSGTALLDSTIPLQARDGDGSLRPVDLSLQPAQGGLKPQNALEDVDIPGQLGNGVELPDAGIGISLVGAASQRSPDETQGTAAVFDNAVPGDDTDFIVAPTPIGVELFTKLQSATSATTQTYRLDLPSGAELREGSDDGAVVSRGGDVIADIHPPSAVDAAGNPVPVQMHVEGDELHLTESLPEDAAMPVLVDPVFDTYTPSTNQGPATAGSWLEGWKPFSSDQSFFNHYSPTSICNPGCGLYVSTRANDYYTNGSLAGYAYSVPRWDEDLAQFGQRPTSFIQSYTMGSIGIWGPANTSPYLLGGIWAPGNGNGIQTGVGAWAGAINNGSNPYAYGLWAPTTTGAYGWTTGYPQTGKQAIFGLYASPTTWEGSATRVAYMGYATVELGDATPPVLGAGGPTGQPSGWVDHASGGIRLDGTDTGLGVQNANYLIPDKTAQPNTLNYNVQLKRTIVPMKVSGTTTDCTGARALPCPRTTSASLDYDTNDWPEGAYPAPWSGVSGKLVDAAGQPSTSVFPMVGVDRSPPSVNVTGGLKNGTGYDLQVAAYDGIVGPAFTGAQSGVRSIEVDVDGQPVGADGKPGANPPGQGCTTATVNVQWWSCPMNRSLTLDRTQYTEGEHELKVIVKDQLFNGNAPQAEQDRHQTVQTYSIYVDRSDSSIYHAWEYDGDPSAGGQLLGEEWAQLNTYNARRVEDGQTTTRGTVACGQSRCGEERIISTSDGDPNGPKDYSTITGRNVSDTGLDLVADIQRPRFEDIGTQTATGSESSLLQAWQTAPQGNDGTYLRYEKTDQDSVDGQPTITTTTTWIDRQTLLPLQISVTVGSDTTAHQYFTYAPTVAALADEPSDFFLASPPDPVGSSYSVNLASNPNAPPEPDEDASPDQYDQALQFRQQAGLSTDPNTITASLNDSSLTHTIADWGVPLYPAEEAEMNVRSDLGNDMPMIVDWAKQNTPDGFGGVWLDNAAGGIVRVGFTSDAADHLDALKQVFPLPDRLASYTASVTQDQLDASVNQVVADTPNIEQSYGVTVTHVSGDVSTGTVTVGIDHMPSPAPTYSGTAAPVVFHQQDVSTMLGHPRADHPVPPMLGGLKILSPGNNECSTGFTYAKLVGFNNNVKYRVLTAGHCSPRASAWWHRDPKNGAKPFGVVKERHVGNTVADNGDLHGVDAEGIQIPDRWRSGRILAHPGDTKTIDGMVNPDAMQKGVWICEVGFRYADAQCGPITDPNSHDRSFETTTGEFTVHRVIRANIDSRLGNSGGAVYFPHRNSQGIRVQDAVGLDHAGDNFQSGCDCYRNTVITRLGYALDALGGTLVTGR